MIATAILLMLPLAVGLVIIVAINREEARIRRLKKEADIKRWKGLE